MKRHYNNIKKCLLLAGGLLAMEAGAQGFSPAAFEQMKMQRLWFQSQNAAGTAFDDVQNYSNLIFGYDWQKGNFARPQDGEKETNVGVSSEGFINLGNAYVWGSFNFSQENLTDAGYNASITDPFRGMPYYFIDEYRSNWKNQYYDLKFRAATPLLKEHWALGIEGTYLASIAAKQRDPRLDSRFYTLELIPGVTYKVNDAHKFGASFRYTSIKEDSRSTYENAMVANQFYELYGLGHMVQNVGNGGYTTNYFGDRFGGALQYNYTSSAWNVLLEGKYSVKAETAEKTYTKPEKIGSVKDKVAEVALTAVRQGKDYTHYIKADYMNRGIDGYQYIMQRDDSEAFAGWVEIARSIRSTYKTDYATLNYTLSKNRGIEYDWKVEAGVTYCKQDDEYILPNSVKNYENLTFNLGVKKNFVLGTGMNRRLLVDIHGAYNNNLGGEYIYGGSNADAIPVTELEQGLQNYYTSNYYRIGGALTYSQQIKEDQRMNMFGKVAVERMSTSDYDYDGRTYVSVSFGCNF